MRRFFCLLAIVGSVSVLGAWQQSDGKAIVRPDFSGTWTSAAGPGGNLPIIEGRGNNPDGQLHVGVMAPKLVISQSADTLKIEEHRQIPGLNTLEYALNGQPVKNQMVIEALENAPSEFTSKWEDNKLVSTIVVFVPAQSIPRRYTETLSVSPDDILAVRIQRVGTPASRTMFYRKAK